MNQGGRSVPLIFLVFVAYAVVITLFGQQLIGFFVDPGAPTRSGRLWELLGILFAITIAPMVVSSASSFEFHGVRTRKVVLVWAGIPVLLVSLLAVPGVLRMEGLDQLIAEKLLFAVIAPLNNLLATSLFAVLAVLLLGRAFGVLSTLVVVYVTLVLQGRFPQLNPWFMFNHTMVNDDQAIYGFKWLWLALLLGLVVVTAWHRRGSPLIGVDR